MADKPLLTGIQLTPLDEAFKQDPYTVLGELRD